ncbi:MAG: RimK family alpha-L-glutamate ligase [Clostridia bacterium]|nr:RimK family alpha-L-glutamate ligase [Clostridia bacterium]
MGRNGVIIVNAYGRPKESVLQPFGLQDEFFKLGVSAQIIKNGESNVFLKDGKIKSLLSADFAVFLDKDKYLSFELEKSGMRLFNRHGAIRLCDDKGETLIRLSDSGLNLPDTVFAPLSYSDEDSISESSLIRIGEKLGFPLVVKESFGSMGKGVYLAENIEELKILAEKLKNKPHIYQKYLSHAFGTDVRVIVIGGSAVGAIKRKNDNDFRSNVAQGGVAQKFELSESFKAAAEKAANLLGLDYCGVDLLFGDAGERYVCDVISNAFFSGFEKATGINVANLYAKYIIKTAFKKAYELGKNA